MPARDDFIQHVRELLAPAGSVAIKRMFGGHGVYLDGLFMAIIADDEHVKPAAKAARVKPASKRQRRT